MPGLERINFWENNLEGGIPISLGNLCSLKELNLGFNKLSGALAVAVKNLSGCAKDSLTLGLNRFNGYLPSFIPFSSLRELDVEYNRLSGHFQDHFGNNSKLMVLNFDGNRFPQIFQDYRP
ncbi:receptor like protein 12 [Hibiscus trionum]|uniref:Receptor like protein 12 n=1 Tax=Hibiscus trionum TaxID=183268 RepID=A0A9W7J825_HIBTR|nr:receptor like protein 12 [Hibiscus trionum]